MKKNKVHDNFIIIDGHCDSVLDLTGNSFTHPENSPRDFYSESDWGQVDFPKLKKSGTTCQVMAMFTPDHLVDQAEKFTWKLSDKIETLYNHDIVRALKGSDIRRAKKTGKVALLKSLEGAEAMGSSLENLREFYQRGVRMVGLTYNRINALGRGCGTPGTKGLTALGREVVKEMARLGMIVDASHLSDEGLEDLLLITERPIVASHSNSRFIQPHRRNLTDKQLEAIAKTGGLVALTYSGIFVHENPEEVTFKRLMEHLDHMLSVVGPAHIGLGSDFDGFTKPYGICMNSCLDIRKITGVLQGKGWRKREIAMIMGGNWLRVIEEVTGN